MANKSVWAKVFVVASWCEYGTMLYFGGNWVPFWLNSWVWNCCLKNWTHIWRFHRSLNSVAIGCPRAAYAQSFTLRQQATIEITRRDHSIIACSRHIYMGVVVRTHPVRGESHIQRNANGEVATVKLSLYLSVFNGVVDPTLFDLCWWV